MSNKAKGILTSIGLFVLIIVLAIIMGLIMNATSSDGWAALGAILMVMMLGLVLFIILLIVGFVLYFKKQSEYGMGIIQGVGIVSIVFLLFWLATMVM